ncbi:MAG: hypothetical protein GY832_17535 [Chloroflexi bacterium]|nr:hypothetical protein [Chloroflexota bacterium]
MANNLHISYNPNAPGQDYGEVIEAIKSLGNWAKVHESFWYVDSTKTAIEACDIVWAACDANDTVYVIDVTNSDAAWNNISDEAVKQIMAQWNK